MASAPARWLAEYRVAWLRGDIIAGVTLAAYAIPVSLAYAGLAGLPPEVGVYGYLLGGLGYALLGSSRQLAIGPTSAISLMIAGTVGAMAGGDVQHYAQIASLAGFTVAILCVIAWLLRLSTLVKLISDSVLVGFKAGAGLTIAMTQLPSLLGVAGGGHNFFERAVLLAGQIGQSQLPRTCHRHHRDRAAGARRTHAAWHAGCARRCGSVDRRCNLTGASRSRRGHDRRNSGRSAQPGRSCVAPARCRRYCAACRRLPAPRLYRKRLCGPDLRCEARICISTLDRNFSASVRQISQPRWDMAIPWPAGCRNRPSMTRRVRARRSPLSLHRSLSRCACFSYRAVGKPAEGGSGCGRVDRGVRAWWIFRRCCGCGASAGWISTLRRSPSWRCCFLAFCREYCSLRSLQS